MKHSLQLEEQADEGISHASELEDEEKVSVFHDLQEGARRLREQFKARVDPSRLILEVRALRKRAEILDPSFNLEKCKSCGNAEEMLSELRDMDRNTGESLGDLERGMAEKVLSGLSKKYGVKPPKLEILDECHEPSEGHYKLGTIRMCRGGINEHVLIHEFGHYMNDLKGKPLDEDDAEAFAVNIIGKDLNSRGVNHSYSDRKMKVSAQVKEVALAVGGVNVGWGIGYAAKAYGDPALPTLMGQKASLYVDVLGTIAGVVVALKSKKESVRKAAAFIAAGLSTHLWEDAEAALAPAAAAAQEMVVAEASGYPTVGVGAVGTMNPNIPSFPSAAPRLAEYPFAAPVSTGPTMSPPHYTIDGVPGIKNVVLGPKYMLDSF